MDDVNDGTFLKSWNISWFSNKTFRKYFRLTHLIIRYCCVTGVLISVWINCVTASQGFSLVKFSQMNWSASLNPIPMAQCGRMNSSLANFPRICQSLIWRWKVSSAKVVQFLYKVNLVTQSRTVDAGKLRSQPNLHSTRPQVSSMPLSAPLSNFQHFPWRHELLIYFRN